MYAILNNTPSPGYIQWSSVNIQYNGVSYAIADGYTNYTYVYWLAASPGTFVVSDTFPALTAADVLVFLNKSGIAMVVPSATILDGGLIVPGSVMASDAFFPFKDTVELAAQAGIPAIIQPGGSICDQLSIEECDRHGISMIFTGMRHFKH